MYVIGSLINTSTVELYHTYRLTDSPGAGMPRGRELRQFRCDCDGHRWIARGTESQCNKCDEDGELIPEGEEVGVFVFNFHCDCGNQYTVKCERSDTAECYECGEQDNEPLSIVPRGFIVRKTDKKHSCSKCRGRGNCPNLARH